MYRPLISWAPTINGILQKIQTLNDSIRKSDIHGGPGLELRDERNLLLDQLYSSGASGGAFGSFGLVSMEN